MSTNAKIDLAHAIEQKALELSRLIEQAGISREVSIAKTKVEEANMWAQRALIVK